MTEAKFTKGPWELNHDGMIYGQPGESEDEAPFVADVCRDSMHAGAKMTAREKANGMMIAAAPELYEACQLLANRASKIPLRYFKKPEVHAFLEEVESAFI